MYTNSVYHFICIPICIPLLKRLPKNTIENYRLRRMNRYYLISIIKMIIEHYRKGSDVPQLHHFNFYLGRRVQCNHLGESP